MFALLIYTPACLLLPVFLTYSYNVGELGQFTTSSDRNRDDDIPLRLSDSTI
jgi:hypothetical protein